ncbi:dihydroxyacetone kinase subunit DhaK [Siminovitchia sp. 179-K 8D1 HS]|uniref:dihydroxyacetone kinase subunit DhaK n=1 Tax=Siminovitchia sp. 179-K 8D1 HS TaxID=3142385 RepID=UPI0039A36675
MKKIINDPNNFVDEVLSGIVRSHADQLRFVKKDKKGIVRKNAPIEGKVAIATGGGAGHLPLFLGYVGDGLVDGVSVGNVFTSPSADTMYEVCKEINSGNGILLLYGNYFGDKMNFDLTQEMLEEEGIEVRSIRISDDVASAPRREWKKRRGVAGIYFAYRIAGAAAKKGYNLIEVKRITEEVAENVATMGVALSPCTIPESNKPTFEISNEDMEIGMGIHGEPGVERKKLLPASDIVKELLDYLISDLKLKSGDEITLLINGAGATPLEELYIIANEVHNSLENQKIEIHSTKVGEYATSLEMSGMSISILKLTEEMKELLNTNAYSPFVCEKEV